LIILIASRKTLREAIVFRQAMGYASLPLRAGST
jgi:hypothetical protein